MTLHIAWMKFKRVALRGKSAKEISAIKPVFYAGMTAGLFELKDILGFEVGKHSNNQVQRQINARFTELDDYKRVIEGRST